MKTGVFWRQVKRFSALAAVVLSILFLLVSLAGIAGVWLLRAQANRILNGLFDAADSAVTASAAKIDTMTARRREARAGLDELSTEIEKLGDKVNDAPVVLMGIDQLLEGRLVPALQKLDQSGRQLYTDLAGLDAAVTALNSTFLFRDQQGALDDLSATLGFLLESLQQLDEESRALEARLRERKADTVQTLVASGQALLDPMYSRLTESEARLAKLRERLDKLQTGLETARAGMLRTINWITVILTAVLAWLATSQVLAGRHAWDVYRTTSTGGPNEEPGETVLDPASA